MRNPLAGAGGYAGAERMCLHGKCVGCFFQYCLFNYNKRKEHFKTCFETVSEAKK
jgi:hypothetical protein